MKIRTTAILSALMLAAVPVMADPAGTISGDYVEARTAEVFTGGCIMGSEAETMGRQAVLAWRVGRGSFNGVALDGLSMVAALAGDRNLGIQEIGGLEPTVVKTALMIDERATASQRDALVALARSMGRGLTTNIVEVKLVPIQFERNADRFLVSAGGDATLSVATKIPHQPSCGAMQWFHPLAAGTDASIGLTNTQMYWGSALGSRWSQRDKRLAFFGTFTY